MHIFTKITSGKLLEIAGVGIKLANQRKKKCFIYIQNILFLVIFKSGINYNILSAPTVIETERGSKMLLYKGFRFGLRKVSGFKVYWRCVKHSSGCKGTVVTVDNVVVSDKEHNHLDYQKGYYKCFNK